MWKIFADFQYFLHSSFLVAVTISLCAVQIFRNLKCFTTGVAIASYDDSCVCEVKDCMKRCKGSTISSPFWLLLTVSHIHRVSRYSQASSQASADGSGNLLNIDLSKNYLHRLSYFENFGLFLTYFLIQFWLISARKPYQQLSAILTELIVHFHHVSCILQFK